VLDEADRLLDMGFEQKVAQIVELVRGRQQGAAPWRMALLSATLHSRLGNLANLAMRDPEAIGGRRGAAAEPPARRWAGPEARASAVPGGPAACLPGLSSAWLPGRLDCQITVRP
jgi:hypothetical protein